MRIQVPMTRGADKKFTTECKPNATVSNPPLDGLYPDSEWLSDLPFDTSHFLLSISDQPYREGEVHVALPKIPFVRSTKRKTRFEIQNDRGRRLRSSKQFPVTQSFLRNEALSSAIKSDQGGIYLGISPLRQPASQGVSERTKDTTQFAGMSASQDDSEADSQSRDLSAATASTRDEADRAAALDWLAHYMETDVVFQHGARLTSLQILARIRDAAPAYEIVRHITRADITRVFKMRYRVGMEKASARIDGKHQKYWLNFALRSD